VYSYYSVNELVFKTKIDVQWLMLNEHPFWNYASYVLKLFHRWLNLWLITFLQNLGCLLAFFILNIWGKKGSGDSFLYHLAVLKNHFNLICFQFPIGNTNDVCLVANGFLISENLNNQHFSKQQWRTTQLLCGCCLPPFLIWSLW